MVALVPLEPVDYLVIGHLTEDLTPAGPRLGGTAAFASLTAQALGLRTGIITSVRATTSLGALDGIPILNVPSSLTTTFENLSSPSGRVQILHGQATSISPENLPDVWRRSPIVHLGPVAQELAPECARDFPASFIGITPQGWMRTWDDAGRVLPSPWTSAEALLPLAGAVVISREDVQANEEVIEAMAHRTRVLAVTEGAAGSVLYWNGDRRRFRAPDMNVVDDTGAGDVFAAAFFIRLYLTRDPWEAARFATQLAGRSVTRRGLDGIPTAQEIESCRMEVLQ